MKVVIDQIVFDVITDFYRISRTIHPSLGLETCLAKQARLEAAVFRFADYAESFHNTPYRADWQKAGYCEFIAEDFHFAYKIYELPDGEKVLIVHDAIHSLLNYNPSDKESSVE